MEEPELRTRVSWIVGLLLATAFVGTIVYSVAQDSDDDGGDADEAVSFDEVGDALDPSVTFPVEPGIVTEVPRATLTVDPGGCGVARSMLPEDPDSLLWVVKGVDGVEVLSRNALEETQYFYYREGEYTVVLEAWNGDGYVEISNTVDISC